MFVLFHSVFICLCLLCFFNGADAQDFRGRPCETPNEEKGICVNVYDCKTVTDILSNPAGVTAEYRSFVKSLTCGFYDGKPYVCCPQQAGRIVDPSNEPVDPNLGSEETNGDPPNFLSPPECGRTSKTHPKIVGGSAALLGHFPWMVELGYYNKKNPSVPKWLCGGSLITYNHVLTAAHCVYNRRDLYLARIGDLDLYSDNDGASPVDMRITDAKVHEGYDQRKFINDIAVLVLEKSVKDMPSVHPICLPWQPEVKSQPLFNTSLYVAGWGAVYFNGPSSSWLQYVSVVAMDNRDCARVYGNQTIIDERIICAGYARGGQDACKGDSGGPLMRARQNKAAVNQIIFYLTGVVSYGYRCAEPGYPGVYTKVTHFLNWINKNVN